jgi:hypothetical protein
LQIFSVLLSKVVDDDVVIAIITIPAVAVAAVAIATIAIATIAPVRRHRLLQRLVVFSQLCHLDNGVL